MSAENFCAGVPQRTAIFWVTARRNRSALVAATLDGAVLSAFAQRPESITGGMFVTCWPTPRVDRRGLPIYRVLAGRALRSGLDGQ